MATNKHDGLNWLAHAHVAKYSPAQTEEMKNFLGREPKADDWARYEVTPKDTAEEAGNLLVTVGLNRITNLIIGTGSIAAFANNRAIVGVGSTATGATPGDVALGADGTTGNGSVGSWYQAVDATYPTAVNGLITAVSTFASSDGNFAWAEWAWGVATTTVSANKTFATASTTGVLLNHKIASLGTKASGASWVFTTTVTLS